MPDYSKCMIYKLCCRDTSIEDIYIGSTCNFYRRKAQHKSVCNNENSKKHNYPVYQFIREHGGFENWDMIMIQEKAVENKLEKEKFEREFIERLKPSLNCIIPTRTKKEYRQQNKQKIAKQKKEYYEENKAERLEKIKEYSKNHKEQISEWGKTKITCDCGNMYTNKNKARHLRTQKHQKFLNQ